MTNNVYDARSSVFRSRTPRYSPFPESITSQRPGTLICIPFTPVVHKFMVSGRAISAEYLNTRNAPRTIYKRVYL